jgi:hypothetical protein
MKRRRGDVSRRRGDSGEANGGDGVNWVDTNLTGPKNEENPRDRFSCYK